MTVQDLLPYLLEDTKVFGDLDMPVAYLRKMSGDFTEPHGMVYIKTDDEKIVSEHPASIIITCVDVRLPGKVIIRAKNPRLQMARFSHLFAKEKTASMVTHACELHYTAQLFPRVTIGKGTKIYPGAVFYSGVTVGENCIIHANAVIGADGFGYEQDTDGTWFKIAHLGGVQIGNNVEIGSCACIDRGTLGDTIIEDGCKIDNLVHIAHNVRVKKNSFIIANAMIGGSVEIGESCWIAPSASIREQRKIGDNALVGLGSVVVNDVAPNSTVLGVPAKPR